MNLGAQPAILKSSRPGRTGLGGHIENGRFSRARLRVLLALGLGPGQSQQVLGRILDGIAAGDFHPEPSADTCRYCDFQDLCDVGRMRIRERKNDDPHVQTFAEMRGIA